MSETLPTVTDTATMSILANAIKQGVSVEVIERLAALNDAYEKKEAEKAFNRAFTAFQMELPTITKDKTVDYGSGDKHVNYSHASLENIIRTVSPLLGKNGLAYRFERSDIEVDGGFKIGIMGILTHIDGHFVTAIQYGPIDTSGRKSELHGIGSTTSYMERYVMLMLLGIVTADEDDDGQAGSQKSANNSSKSKSKPTIDDNALYKDMERLFAHPGAIIKHRYDIDHSKDLTAPDLVKLRAFVTAYDLFQAECKKCDESGQGRLVEYYIKIYDIDDPEMAKTQSLNDATQSLYYRRRIAAGEEHLPADVYATEYNKILGAVKAKSLDDLNNDRLKALYAALAKAAKK